MPNHLVNERSPYLLQHADNPVDWYPWGEEAFEKARREQKPVFLSIGYATCHWCHVMAEESFENEAVAEVLNRDYIAVKVDREERPDVDGPDDAGAAALLRRDLSAPGEPGAAAGTDPPAAGGGRQVETGPGGSGKDRRRAHGLSAPGAETGVRRAG